MKVISTCVYDESISIRDFVEKEDFSVALIETLVTTTYMDKVPVLLLILPLKEADEVAETLSGVFQETLDEFYTQPPLFIQAGMPPAISPSPLAHFDTYKSLYIAPTVADALIKNLIKVCDEYKEV